MKRRSCVLVALVVMLITCIATPLVSVAAAGNKSSLDSIGKQEATVTEQPQEVADTNTSTSSGDDAVRQLFSTNPSGVTDENMEKAKELTSPVVRVIGILIGIILTVTSSLIFLITALDLLYIAFPPVRSLLNPDYGNSGSAGAMGGMGMGMMGGGMRGYSGMGGMSNPGAASGSLLRRRWVSDEAVQVLASATGGVAQAQQPMGMMGGIGGMGGFGGMGMNQAVQGQASTKSVIGQYFKKRVFFMILFVVCTVVLLSSVLTDCGLNVADLIVRLFGKANDGITNIAN